MTTAECVPERASQRDRLKVIVVLPAYNEEACLARLLDRIDEAMFEANQPYQVLVVDDGSSDRTAEIARSFCGRMPLILVQHAVNEGLGGTIKDGLLRAAQEARDKDVIITMDADDTHTPGLILRMLRMINEGHDVVIASRYQPGARVLGVPWFRRQLSNCASLLFRIVMPISGVRDYTCGYRAYRGQVIKQAIEQYGQSFVDQEGFQCMVDILLKLRKLDLIFGEVPFILRYDFKQGPSKMNVGRTITRTLMLMLKRKFE